MKRNRLIWFFSLLFCCTLLAAQKVTVEGTVTGFPDSEVLMGASVSVKGTTQGTITDLDGKYSLSVAADATLVFSYLGYETKEVAVKNRSLINVSLKADAQDLEEVVVVGTILKKRNRLLTLIRHCKDVLLVYLFPMLLNLVMTQRLKSVVLILLMEVLTLSM